MVCLTHMTERVCVKKLNPHVTCENNGDGNCSIWLTEVYASKKNPDGHKKCIQLTCETRVTKRKSERGRRKGCICMCPRAAFKLMVRIIKPADHSALGLIYTVISL